MRRFSDWIIRNAKWVAGIGTFLALGSVYFTVLLYMNLRPDVEELLPTTARSVMDLGEVTERLESIENLVVLTFSENVKASKRFVIDLAKELEAYPKSVVHSVEYRIDKEIKFFSVRRALYIDSKDLIKIRNFLKRRISYEKELYNPIHIFSGKEIPEPFMDFMALKQKYSTQTDSFNHFPDGFYASEDEKIRALVVYLPGKSSDALANQRLKQAVLDSVEKLNPKTYSPELEVKYTGNVQNMIEEQAALIADLKLSTAIVVILVTMIMILYFRSFWGTMAMVGSLFMGTLWTFGIAYFTVGYLNANSAFLASIVIGNGINFGIMLLARYFEERRRGAMHCNAIGDAMQGTVGATWTAALAAALSYGSLILTGFRGFNQFGVIGLVGMVLCWVSAFTLLPAYLTILDRWVTLVPANSKKRKAYFANAIAQFVSRFPRAISIGSCILVILSLLVIFTHDKEILETDLSKLRDKTSMTKGSGALYHHINDIFKRNLSPIVILPRSKEDARKIAKAFRDKLKKEKDELNIASIQTLDDFVPSNQKERIRIIRQIKKILPERLLVHLSKKDQEMVRGFLTPEALKPLTVEQLPDLVLNKFREKDGSFGKLVLIDKVVTDKVEDAKELMVFVSTLRNIADTVTPGTPVAGQLPISADMIESIKVDGPRATLFAFLAVILLVTILFRRPLLIGQVLLALFLGVIWLTAIVFLIDLKINFMNFIALPITFGIGVDYGVNIFSRYRLEGKGQIVNVVRNTGGAVALCSATTVIGYGSLLLAGNQAFVSFGLLSVLGELTCSVAAIIALPAMLRYFDLKRDKKNPPVGPEMNHSQNRAHSPPSRPRIYP